MANKPQNICKLKKTDKLQIRYQHQFIEAGCDEAGRGCLAGPVFAAAVILPDDFENEVLNDSKKLNEKQRYELRQLIENSAIAWGVAMVDNKEIDRTNILKSSIRAMHLALEKLTMQPEFVLIDGNRFFRYRQVPYACIIKGDSKFLSIAAASILAKTYRDDYMLSIHDKYPQYAWNKNKGYPTKTHRNLMEINGLCEFHRRSFKSVSKQAKIQFPEC